MTVYPENASETYTSGAEVVIHCTPSITGIPADWSTWRPDLWRECLR